MTRDIFISHSSKDKTIADAICAKLEEENIRCWIAPRDIGPGQDWPTAIVEAIKKSKSMVLVFSKHANRSIQVRKELSVAVNSELTIIPFKIDRTLPEGSMELFLTDTHWLDAMNPPTERDIGNLVDSVRKFLPDNRKIEPEEGVGIQTLGNEDISSLPEQKSTNEARQNGESVRSEVDQRKKLAGRKLEGQEKTSSIKGKNLKKILVWIGPGLIVVFGIMILLWNQGVLEPMAFLERGINTPQLNSTATPDDLASLLEVPDIPTITTTPTISGEVLYIAQEGDTFSTIAEMYSIDNFTLLFYNAGEERLNLDLANPVLSVGDEILIPPSGASIPTPTPVPSDVPSGSTVEYMVLPGDSIEAIASDLRSTVQDIREYNNLEENSSLYTGQIIQVRVNLVADEIAIPIEGENTPTPDIPAEYALKPGEYIYCLAIRFDINILDLLEYNGFDMDSGVRIGDIIKIPQDASPYQGERRLRDHPTTYKVKSGENIYEIACLFGDVFPEQIAEANNITNGGNPYSGQILQIP